MKQDQAKGVPFVTTATVRKWGNSLAIRLPLEVASRAELEDGTMVTMTVTDKNEVILRPVFPAADDQETLRKHFLALRAKSVQNAPGQDKHEEMFDEPMGDEII